LEDESDMTKPFSELGLSADLLKAIDRLGFEQASPIQAAAIPLLLNGRDVVGQSQTGSGKTAAFAAPAIEKVDVAQRSTQVLILCPTRELAVQVSEEVHKLAFFKRGLHALPIYGGQSYDRQFQGLRQGAHIVIGTPGRVMDHMRRGTLRLEALKIVVLDEVDVMLNMGFRDDIELILQATPKERQTVFFSATIPRPIQQLIEKYARDPQNVRMQQKALTVPTVEQVYYEVDRRFKIDLLTRLIDLHDLKLGIIFCNTKRMVDDLVDHLNAQGYSADRLHGDMSQNMRDRVMNKFRRSGLEFLVATDVAARGIDVEDVEVVFNYDLPYDGEDYVHRIGRTGRKGKEGRAISFASGREVFQIRNIERYTNTRIHRGKPPTAGEVEEARANVFLDKIRATLKSGDFKRQDQLIERLLEEGFSTTDIASALLHQLQSADGAAATASRAESYERPDRSDKTPSGSREERSGDRGRGDRFRSADRRQERSRGGERAARHLDALTASPRRESSLQVQPDIAPRVTPAPLKAHGDKILHPPAAAAESGRPAKSKPSPRTPADQTRLFMNIGAAMNISPSDIVNSISGETGLPGKVVGRVDIRERHTFVDVATEHARAVVAKLNRAEVKGHKTKVKVA
jgi:ATP-dependent RNA helicase DeaD